MLGLSSVKCSWFEAIFLIIKRFEFKRSVLRRSWQSDAIWTLPISQPFLLWRKLIPRLKNKLKKVTYNATENNLRTAKEAKLGAMVAARPSMKPTGMAMRSVVRRPKVSAHKPQPYDESITPAKCVTLNYNNWLPSQKYKFKKTLWSHCCGQFLTDDNYIIVDK